jgi:hypothetical protein
MCLECNEALCMECSQHHIRSKRTNKHQLQALELQGTEEAASHVLTRDDD